MKTKSLIAGLLTVILALSMVAVIPQSAKADNMDFTTLVEQQVKAYLDTTYQHNAAQTAATAMLTNAAFLGKDLVFGEESATTSMLLNSFLLQEVLLRSCPVMIAMMQQLGETTLYCDGSIEWRAADANFSINANSSSDCAFQNQINTVAASYLFYNSNTEITEKYNANDIMLVSVAGNIGLKCTVSAVEIREDAVSYRIDCVLRDAFDYNADYSGSDYNRDYEELLSAFGGFVLKSFTWESHFSFCVEVPQACNHTTGTYRWYQDKETFELVSDTSDGFVANPAEKTTYLHTDAEGITTNEYSYQLQDPIILYHDTPWRVEYKVSGLVNFVLAPTFRHRSSLPYIWHNNGNYTWISYTKRHYIPEEEVDAFGSKSTAVVSEHHYGFATYEMYKYNSAHTYTYVMDNVVAEDGSNMVYLTVYDNTADRVVFGPEPMDDYRFQNPYLGRMEVVSRDDDWVSGKDLIINYIGNATIRVNDKLTSVTIYENGVDAPAMDTITQTLVAPSCTENGYMLNTCTKCDYSYKTDLTENLPHDYAAKVVAPTCCAEGYTQYTCTMCGDTYRTDTTEKLPHSCGEYISNNDATCAKDGTKTGKCTVCGEKVTVTDEGTALPHTWTDATCEKAKTCKFCGATEGEPLGHDLKHYNAKAPTCENVGWDAYEKCQRCSYSTFARLPALGHDYRNGVCIRCGDRDGTIVPGEVTGDGKIDMADAYRIILYLSGKLTLNEDEQAAADVNGDGTVDFIDIYRIILYYREVTKQ